MKCFTEDRENAAVSMPIIIVSDLLGRVMRKPVLLGFCDVCIDAFCMTCHIDDEGWPALSFEFMQYYGMLPCRDSVRFESSPIQQGAGRRCQ